MLRAPSRADRTIWDDLWEIVARVLLCSLAGVGVLALMLWMMFG